MINGLLKGLLSLVYPCNCLICSKHIITQSPTEFLCLQCFRKLTNNFPPFCVKCSRHLSSFTHNKCRSCKNNEVHFDFAWSACLYSDIAKELLHMFKYRGKTLLRKTFSRKMIDFITEYNLDIAQFDIITPIPLHRTKKRERGFNQSELIANDIGKHFNIPVRNDIIIRKQWTKSQTLLHKKERWTNMQGAFRIKPSINTNNISILIVDDLITTGATASEAARILKENGAKTVGILSFAIAI